VITVDSLSMQPSRPISLLSLSVLNGAPGGRLKHVAAVMLKLIGRCQLLDGQFRVRGVPEITGSASNSS
jgi:hypothetical protein